MLPPRHILSKSTYMYGVQCTKRLWLYKNNPELATPVTEAQAAIFQSGTNIGQLAQQLFPYGVDASPAELYLYPQSIADTAKYIRNGANVIYEAAFQFEGVMAALDILVKQNGKWYGFEVKGSTKVKPQFIHDAALQYHVITGSGLALEDISIIHLNNEYVRQGELDIQQLFKQQSILLEVETLQPMIAADIEEFKEMLKLKKPPAIEPGDQCFKPYDCPFYDYCTKGMETEEEDPEPTHINHKAIQEFLKQLVYPVHHLDFETWMTGIPEQDGHWPFRQIPFQYSLHIQRKPGAEPEHQSWLASGPQATIEEFANALLKDIEPSGSILVYNLSFEKTILTQIAEDFPKLAPKIKKIQARLIDLMIPFKKNYRLPAMQGLYSIKNVLPAVVPGLSYEGMEIANGADASSAFYNIKNETDPEKVRSTREALEKYCGLDTMAMVKLLGELIKVKS